MSKTNDLLALVRQQHNVIEKLILETVMPSGDALKSGTVKRARVVQDKYIAFITKYDDKPEPVQITMEQATMVECVLKKCSNHYGYVTEEAEITNYATAVSYHLPKIIKSLDKE